ncbi:MAG: NAD(P)H-hydrate dehydratase [Candidatus Riflebacteria bacterium]|nr:NAD(P)H-hydrate dehydratase [Candidatus Riflebacteria bacterium]
MRLVTAAEMREIDRHAIQEIGISSLVLMENAGLKTLMTIEKAFSGLHGKRFTIVCGKGNNGGDGLVIARHLFNHNVTMNVYLLAAETELSGDCLANYKILLKSGFRPTFIENEDGLDELRVALEFSDFAIDAIFGTGFTGGLKDIAALAVTILNESKVKKISLDVPSGLCATTGKISNPCVRADITVTLGLPKIGLYLPPGSTYSGEIWVADIGIPSRSVDLTPGRTFLLNQPLVSSILAERSDFAHKGTFGNLLILAGSKSYQGAGVLCTYGALRSGAGIVTLGIPSVIAERMLCEVPPEVIVRSFASDWEGFDISENHIKALSGHYRAIAAGSGWGTGEKRKDTLKAILTSWNGSLLLDADALNSIGDPGILNEHKGEKILTPHPGEMAALTQKSVAEILENPLQAAADFVAKYQCVLILKGAVTIIASSDGRILVSSRPNSSLARGGSGDLLAGVVGGFLAQGYPAFSAAAIGTFLHSEAASAARAKIGADSVTISEIASCMPEAFKSIRNPSGK